MFFFFNGILVSGLFAPFFEKHLLRSVQFGPLPSLDRLLLEFVAICVVEDAYFYYVHRLSHQWRWFYPSRSKILGERISEILIFDLGQEQSALPAP